MIKLISRSIVNPRQWLRFARTVWYLLKARWAADVRKDLIGSVKASDSPSSSLPPLTGRQIRAIRREIRFIEIISAFPFQWAFCLQKSRALVSLLRRHGIEADLRIGVRKSVDRLSAHAWVEYNGIVLNDHKETPEEFSVLLPVAGASFDSDKLEWEK